MNLTPERLREVLSYDPGSGEFTWRVALNSRAKAGSRAGSINTCGYIQIKIDGRPYMAHRLAWLHVYGRWPTDQIDHVNRVRDDNRISNLREATKAQNQASSAGQRSSKLGVKGVTRRKDGKYCTQIKANGKSKHLGMYGTLTEAFHAYHNAASVIQGEFYDCAIHFYVPQRLLPRA